jgi:TolC family type I secretion outer membrane protein
MTDAGLEFVTIALTKQTRGARHRLPLSLVLSAALLAGAAWPAGAETLEEAMASAYNTNPQLLAERAKVRGTDELVNQAQAGYRPNIQLQAEGGPQRVIQSIPHSTPSFTNPTGTGDSSTRSITGNVDASLVQNLYAGGGTVAATEQAENQVIAERANLVATEETVLFAVITAYYDVLRDISAVNYDRQYVTSLQQIAAGTRGTAQIGALTQVDVAQAEGRLQTAIAQQSIDEGQLEADRGEYEAAVGHLPDTLVEPTLKARIPVNLNDAVNLATKNNPKVVSLTYTERSDRAAVAVEEAKLLPSIDLVLDRNVSTNTLNSGLPQNLVQNSSSAQVRLTVPFYNQGMTWSQSRQAIETVGADRGNTDFQRRQAVQSARQAWQQATTLRKAVTASTAAVAADQKAATGAHQQQLAGEISILDELIELENLYGDQITLARNVHDQHLAEFNLMMQIGILTAGDLGVNVNRYDPTKHYDSVRSKLLGLDSDK